MLERKLALTIRLPALGVDDSINEMVSKIGFAGKYFAGDPLGNPIPASGTGNDSALRTDLASTLSGADGSRLSGFRRTDSGSVARSVYIEILDREVNLKDFGPAEDRSTDARAAFVNAFAACNPGDTLLIPRPATGYRISEEIVVNKSNITIKGPGSSGGSGNAGAFKPIILFNSPTVGASCFRWSTYAENVNIFGIGIDSKTAAKQHKLLRFFELHSSAIRGNWLEGLGTAGDDQTGIQFDGGGLYTGASIVAENYITNCKFGIDIQGKTTTLLIFRNELTGTGVGGVAGSVGIRLAGGGINGVQIDGGAIQQFAVGIDNTSVGLSRGPVYFENNGVNEDHHTSTDICLFGHDYINGPVPTLLRTAAARNFLMGRNQFFAACVLETASGILERGYTANMGEWTPRTFAAGNFTANGTMTWTVSADDVITDAYMLVGKTMTYAFSLQTTVVGGVVNTDLQILIPGGFNAAKRMRSASVHVLNNAVNSTGVVEATVSGNKLRILKDTASTNYVAGATEVFGVLAFEVQ
jgi:hypothetical protein